MPTRQSIVEYQVLVTGNFVCNGRQRSELVVISGTHDSTNGEIVTRAVNSVGISSTSAFYPRERFNNLSGDLKTNLTRPPAPVIN